MFKKISKYLGAFVALGSALVGTASAQTTTVVDALTDVADAAKADILTLVPIALGIAVIFFVVRKGWALMRSR